MATYTHAGLGGSPTIPWIQVDIDGDDPISTDGTLIILQNDDGTQTRISGSGFTFSGGAPTGGTVDTITRTNAAGTSVYETVSGLSLSLVTLFSFDDNNETFAFIFSGDDTFTGSAADNYFVGGPGADAFTGGMGTDFVSYENATTNVVADLGNDDNNTGDAAGDTYLGIEGLVGSEFNDSLRGNGMANTLIGGGGNDFLLGRGGGDVLNGGAGEDFADYISSAVGLIVDLGTPSNNSGDAIGDSYISIEHVRGSDHDDTLRGDSASNFLRGGLGADSLQGGGGSDWADYRGSASGLTVDLATPANNTGEAEGDSYSSIENIRGSDFDDTLRGNSINNVLRGGLGEDILEGGGGSDAADYYNSTIGLTVDLANPGNNTGEAAGDTFVSIERIYGTAFDDELYGDGGNNALEGREGADLLDGRGGSDTARYGNAGSAVIASLADQSVNTGDAAGDTYISIENLIGSRFDDTLIGDDGSNFLYGGAGADILRGGAASDWADYLGTSSGVTVDLANPLNNTGEAAGDTYERVEFIRGTDFADILRGDADNNFLRGHGGADELDGGDGNDMADYGEMTAGFIADLANPGNNTGNAAGDTYISIERLRGGSGDDELYGDDGNNHLEGGAGADHLDGRDGFDMARYASATAGVTASLADQSVNTGEAAGDVYVSIEGLMGSRLDDILIGDAGDNILTGAEGADVLDGGDGRDLADYLFFRTDTPIIPVIADLANPGNNAGDAAGDTYISIESLRGTDADDELYGDGGSNRLEGRDGADILDGRDGIDFANYNSATTAVTASLANPGSNTGHAAGDTYVSIEGLIGSDFDDTLIGDAGDNHFYSGLGDDTIDGGGGIDTLWFSTVASTDATWERTLTGWTVTSAIGVETLTGIERLEFTDGTVVLGAAPANDVTGDGTSDILWLETASQFLGFYEMSDSAVAGWGSIGVGAAGWTMVGKGDFTGDGTTDLLWQSDTGDVGLYEMSGGAVASWIGVNSGTSGWSVVGTGDYNGDATSDVLWQEDASGFVGLYEMNGGVATWASIGTAPGWSIMGSGDFTGDGTDDILWQEDSSGFVGFYEMSDSAVAAWGSIGVGAAGWSMVGIGDFNGDGTDDLLWQSDTGEVGFYQMDGGAVAAWVGVNSGTSGWSVVGTGDYNGDGTDDILWQEDASGFVGMYEMHDGVATWINIGTSAPGWEIV